jgi:hypothetical protein
MENVKFSYLKIGERPNERAYGTLIKGVLSSTKARLHMPKEMTGKEQIWLTLETWNGELYQVSWSLH